MFHQNIYLWFHSQILICWDTLDDNNIILVRHQIFFKSFIFMTVINFHTQTKFHPNVAAILKKLLQSNTLHFIAVQPILRSAALRLGTNYYPQAKSQTFKILPNNHSKPHNTSQDKLACKFFRRFNCCPRIPDRVRRPSGPRGDLLQW